MNPERVDRQTDKKSELKTLNPDYGVAARAGAVVWDEPRVGFIGKHAETLNSDDGAAACAGAVVHPEDYL